MKIKNISDQAVHSTIRIECSDSKGNISSGTGFIYNFCKEPDGRCVPALVTNKHVVEGAVEGRLHFHKAGADGEPEYGNHTGVVLPDFESAWVFHPDSEVDLAAFALGGLIQELTDKGRKPYYKAVDEEILALNEDLENLSAVEDILMVGYPNGLWDAKNNLPITRRGVTATPPYIDFDQKKQFMIDCACFPGSSGSPVFLYNAGSYERKSGGTQIGGRFKLIGVLWGGPQHTAAGEIKVVPIPTGSKPIALSKIPNNLGYCIKAEELLAFEDHFRAAVSNGN